MYKITIKNKDIVLNDFSELLEKIQKNKKAKIDVKNLNHIQYVEVLSIIHG